MFGCRSLFRLEHRLESSVKSSECRALICMQHLICLQNRHLKYECGKENAFQCAKCGRKFPHKQVAWMLFCKMRQSVHGFGQSKFPDGGSVLGLSQFSILLQLKPQLKNNAPLKVFNMEPKIIISFCLSKSMTHSFTNSY